MPDPSLTLVSFCENVPAVDGISQSVCLNFCTFQINKNLKNHFLKMVGIRTAFLKLFVDTVLVKFGWRPGSQIRQGLPIMHGYISWCCPGHVESWGVVRSAQVIRLWWLHSSGNLLLRLNESPKCCINDVSSSLQIVLFVVASKIK